MSGDAVDGLKRDAGRKIGATQIAGAVAIALLGAAQLVYAFGLLAPLFPRWIHAVAGVVMMAIPVFHVLSWRLESKKKAS